MTWVRFRRFIFGTCLSETDNGDDSVTIDVADGTITEAKLGLSDNTTANASTSKHGFLKKLSNVSTEVMNGVGNWIGVVTSIKKTGSASLTGDVTLTGGANMTLTQTGNDITFAATITGGGAVDSLNAAGDTPMTGALEIAAGTGITVTQDDVDTITIAASGASTDGWISPGHTLVYVSASSVKVTGADVTAIYQVGTFVRFKQGGGYKYMFVTSASFSTDTTINLTGGTDYTVANASITDNYYSYQANPQGWPGWFNYTITWGGFTATTPTVETSKFCVVGRVCFVEIRLTAGGTSNATSLTISLPFVAIRNGYRGAANVSDNGAGLAAPGVFWTNAGSATMNVYKDFNATGWTNVNGKSAQGTFAYDI